MKSAILRPQAARDRQAEVRYCRKEAGSKVEVRFVNASNAALDQLEPDSAASTAEKLSEIVSFSRNKTDTEPAPRARVLAR